MCDFTSERALNPFDSITPGGGGRYSNLNNSYRGGQCPNLDDDEDGRALDYRGFGQKFGVPPGIDLEAEPEVALEAAVRPAEQRPDALQPAPEQSAPQPQPTPRSMKKRAASRRSGDPGPTYEDLRQQLEYLQQVQASASKDAKKPAASVSPQKEGMTNSA